MPAIDTHTLLGGSNQSEARQIAELKLKRYLETGFSVLLLGKRGTGKTELAKRLANGTPLGYYSISKGIDSWDEKLGRWRGHRELIKIRETALRDANGGILYLDDIDQLSEPLQKRLMYMLRDYKNKVLRLMDMGEGRADPITCNIVFASTKEPQELIKEMRPEFYDFISKQVVTLPELRRTRPDRQADWIAVWKNLGFDEDAPESPSFLEWLTTKTLPGNFRDLERVAILYHTYQYKFEPEEKKKIGFQSVEDFIESEHQTYHDIKAATRYNFSDDKTTSQMLTEYKKDMFGWAFDRFGQNIDKIVDHFSKLGEPISKRTLYNWKKGENA